ncbi:MAG: AAA family ATPase [Massiliimalia sp.]|jgi:predicted kinase
MAKVICICGKICSGKSWYARQLQKAENAVILSCDEITTGIFDGNLGDQHEIILEKVKQYLLSKSLEMIACGCNVILEWGFWTEKEREQITQYYRTHNIDCQWHYVDISDEDWQRNIRLRNLAVAEGKTSDYPLDEGLLQKLTSVFEQPEKDSMDVWHQNH